jgi:hypothetical protein
LKTILDMFKYVKAGRSPNFPCLQLAKWDHGKYGFGYGLIEPGRAIFQFCGTDGNIKDWVRNFKFLPNKEGMHQGFVDEYSMYRDQVHAFAREVQANGVHEWFVCGYSQGAATSGICSADLSEYFNHPISCINYGSPLYLTSDARNRFNKLRVDCTNVINQLDIVTKVVPLAKRPGKDYVLQAPWWKKIFPSMIAVEVFADHTLQAYEAALNKESK